MVLPENAGTAGSLRLRTWQPRDAPALLEAIAVSRAHLAPWMAWATEPEPTLEEQLGRFRAWERRRRSGEDGYYGIFFEDRVVGGCGLHGRLAPGGMEIGYWVHVGYLRRGIARTTTSLLLDTAFLDPRITFVEVHHDRANLASGAVPRSLGFTLVGESADGVAAPGECGIERRWRMTRETWARREPEPPGA